MVVVGGGVEAAEGGVEGQHDAVLGALLGEAAQPLLGQDAAGGVVRGRHEDAAHRGEQLGREVRAVQGVLLDGDELQAVAAQQVGDVVEGRVDQRDLADRRGERPGEDLHGDGRGVAAQDAAGLRRVAVLAEQREVRLVGLALDLLDRALLTLRPQDGQFVHDLLLTGAQRLPGVAVRDVQLTVEGQVLPLGEVLLELRFGCHDAILGSGWSGWWSGGRCGRRISG